MALTSVRITFRSVLKMSKAIDFMFQTSLDQALREERHNADRWRQEADSIDIVHLLCSCGKPFKEKLLTDLLIASSLSFETFMVHFFYAHLGESQREIEVIIIHPKGPFLCLFAVIIN